MRFLVIGFSVVLAFAGYSWVWFDKAAELETLLNDNFQAMNQPGIATGFDSIDISGYPYRMEALVMAPRIELTSDSGNIVMTTDQILIHSRPFSHDHLIATTDRNPRFEVRSQSGDQLLLSMVASQVSASFVKTEIKSRFTVDANNVAVSIMNLPSHQIHDLQYHQRMGNDGPEFHLRLSHNKDDDQGISATGPMAMQWGDDELYVSLTEVRTRYAGLSIEGSGRLILQPSNRAGLEVSSDIKLNGWQHSCPDKVLAGLNIMDQSDGRQDGVINAAAHIGLDGIQIGPAILQGARCRQAN